MRLRSLFPMLAAGALVVTACGDDDAAPAAPPPPPATASAPTVAAAPAAASIAAKSGDSALGEILVGADGMTLYGFTNDTDGQSTCSGTCADAWPPVLVDEGWTVGPGLDTAIFSTIPRDDGTFQLVVGKWPLYYFSGDTAPGTLEGQGSGDVWFVAGLEGKLVKGDRAAPATTAPAAPASTAPPATAPAPSATVSVAETSLGHVLVDSEGFTLYGFTDDVDGAPTCLDACADAWPPLTVDGDPVAGEGLDPAVLSAVDGPAGRQVKAGVWPLYRFSGDGAPGDVNGQGSGGKWFVVAADGSLVEDAQALSGGDAPTTDSPYDY